MTPGSRVGFVGLGTMGAPMAKCLLRAGFSVQVFDVSPAAVSDLVTVGASAAPSLAGLAATADILMVAVVNDAQVRSVIAGSNGEAGLLSAARRDTGILIHSTIHPDVCIELAAMAEASGVSVLDAPMTGSPAAAAAGALSFMVGGDPSALERCRPALQAVGSRITHLGPVGSGQIAKLANNLAIAVTMRAVREALQLAATFGISSDDMLALLGSGGADSWVARNWRTIGQTAEKYPGGATGLANLTHKDVALALALAHRVALPIPTAALTSQLLGDAYEAAHADALANERADDCLDDLGETSMKTEEVKP